MVEAFFRKRLNNIVFVFLAILCGATATGQMNNVSFNQVSALPTVEPDAVYRYGEAPQQFGELWLPEPPSHPGHPLVILIHGGCWLNEFDVSHSRAMSMALAAEGYAVWSIEYRRIGDPGGGWPGTFEDIGLGVDFVQQLAAHPVDLNRIVLVGHSAGGHLALWASARAGFSADHPLYTAGATQALGAVGLAAIVDLESYARGSSSCEKAAVKLMGGAPEELLARYKMASPIRLGLLENTLLIQGTEDRIVPVEHLDGLPDRDRIVRIPGAGHFDLIHPGSDAWSTVTNALRGMFSQ
jgi:acetyl esterase/lipase